MTYRPLLEAMVHAAAGRKPADLLVRNARIVDVFSGHIVEAPLAIGAGRVLGFFETEAEQELDAKGSYLLPGLIDGHVHIESSLVSPTQFARLLLPRGTTAVIADPHEIANVCGLAGIRYILDATKDIPLDVRVMLPSCVPATPFEDAGATLGAAELAALMEHPRVAGLGEMMNYPGVVEGFGDVLDKIALALNAGKAVDGHSPGLDGRGLATYAVARIGSDHECSTIEEMHERIRLGMYVLLREGSAARNLATLARGITPANARRCIFCTDDRQPEDILNHGHIDNHLRMAVAAGVDPITAVTIATLNAAECYNLRDRGAIAPGRVADFVLVEDLKQFTVQQVWAQGKLVAQDGAMTIDLPETNTPEVMDTVRIAPLADTAFALPLRTGVANIIGVLPHSILTEARQRDVVAGADGLFHAAQNPGLVKMAVVERHHATGNVAVALIEGYGLTGGAIATTVAHDSHNIVVAGDNDTDMMAAVHDLVRMGGGITMCCNGAVRAHLPLPIAGLMSDQPGPEVSAALADMLRIAREELHVAPGIEPFMTLSFLTLPVIPELKLTDRGLFDVRSFSFTAVQ